MIKTAKKMLKYKTNYSMKMVMADKTQHLKIVLLCTFKKYS